MSVIHPRARLAGDSSVGPFCYIGPEVTIGSGTRLESHVTLMGRVTLGRDNRLFPGVVLGGDPQQHEADGFDSEVLIGHGNVLREGVVINRGATTEDGLTVVGHDCYLQAGCHLEHDCRLGDRVCVGTGTVLGPLVHLHDDVTLGAGSAVHTRVTIGTQAHVSSHSRVMNDVPPYMAAEGDPARVRSLNVAAVERSRLCRDSLDALTEAYELIYRDRVGLDHARQILRQHEHLLPVVNHLLTFLQDQQEGHRGRARQRRRAA